MKCTKKKSEIVDFNEKKTEALETDRNFQGAEDSPTRSTSSFFFSFFFFLFLSSRDRGVVRTLPDSPPSLLSGLWAPLLGSRQQLPPSALWKGTEPIGRSPAARTEGTWDGSWREEKRGEQKKTAPHHFYLIALVWSYEALRGPCKVPASHS